jgi:hypothetical protein
METKELETSIVQVGEETPTDVLLEVGDKIAALGEFVRDLKRQWESKMVDRIEAAGPIVVGDIRYYVGPDKDTKCVNQTATLEACMEASGGDVAAFTEVLSSNAFKPGACRKLLAPERFAVLFVTTERVVLKEGKPAKQLQKTDTRFLR